MSGQIWAVASEGGYLFSANLSNRLQMQVEPLTKFRQFCDNEENLGLGKGDTFYWNVYSKVAQNGRRLDERTPMPETGFTITRHSATVVEAGNSVPFTGKVQALGQHQVEKIVDKVLMRDCAHFMDVEVFLQMKATPLRVAPTGGTSTTAVTLTTNSATATTNNVALGTGHIKAIGDTMAERNIPPYTDDGSYIGITHRTTLRNIKNQLESIKQYTDEGYAQICYGEVGRYEDFRFVEQNNIAKGGANDSTTFDAYADTADAWNNGLSSWCAFFGADVVTEGMVVPEEVRAKLPGDFGRSKGIAWYWLGCFALTHDDATNARVVLWDSAA
jgi:N4-gp56 family major capsid protein